MKNLLALSCLFLLYTQPTQASLLDDVKSSIRPHLVKILGEETTNKILGVDPNGIKLPVIPKVVSNAKDSNSIGLGNKNNVKFSADEEERFNYFFVKDLIKTVQQRQATDSDFNKWMNVLSQNGSRSGVYRALVLDARYMRLEQEPYPVSEKVIEFTEDFIGKYLNKSISRKTLESANFYTVKRDITEKTLEVMNELFKLKGEEIYDWYAVLSQDLAVNYPEAMDNETRKVKSAKAHKRWAMNVPDQYLRSEIFIKLHKVFNRLQVAP